MIVSFIRFDKALIQCYGFCLAIKCETYDEIGCHGNTTDTLSMKHCVCVLWNEGPRYQNSSFSFHTSSDRALLFYLAISISVSLCRSCFHFLYWTPLEYILWDEYRAIFYVMVWTLSSRLRWKQTSQTVDTIQDQQVLLKWKIKSISRSLKLKLNVVILGTILCASLHEQNISITINRALL